MRYEIFLSTNNSNASIFFTLRSTESVILLFSATRTSTPLTRRTLAQEKSTTYTPAQVRAFDRVQLDDAPPYIPR